MTYKQALAYLYSLERFGIKPGLERIKRLLELLGNPQQGLLTIHIAGTNGKGSTATFVSSILKEAGFKVGIYLSPHLTDFRERIAINSSLIPEEKVAELLTKIRPHIIRMAAEAKISHSTFFEVVTAMAFRYFFEEKVDFAVIEVGLGGRLDATNIVESLVSVITNSDYDHMDKLGSAVTSIAREHAGIIKKDGLVVTAARGKSLKVIKEISQKQKARLYEVGKDIRCESLESDWEGQSFNISPVKNTCTRQGAETLGSDDKVSLLPDRVKGAKGIFSEFDNLEISLLGRHQLINACCAVVAVELLKFRNILLSDGSIRRGLKKAYLPGRLELVQHAPLVILDGAHNYPAAKQLKEALLEFLKNKERLILVMGIFKDKEIEKIVKELAPLAFKVLVTAPRTSRAARPEDVYKIVVKYNQNAIVIGEVEEAVRESLNEAEEDDIICVTGSLYTVGEARQLFNQEKKWERMQRSDLGKAYLYDNNRNKRKICQNLCAQLRGNEVEGKIWKRY